MLCPFRGWVWEAFIALHLRTHMKTIVGSKEMEAGLSYLWSCREERWNDKSGELAWSRLCWVVWLDWRLARKDARVGGWVGVLACRLATARWGRARFFVGEVTRPFNLDLHCLKRYREGNQRHSFALNYCEKEASDNLYEMFLYCHETLFRITKVKW